jgi:Tfp pilus assembly protein FimV
MATITMPAQVTVRRPRPAAPRGSAPVRLTARGRRLARTVVVAFALLLVLAFSLVGRTPADAGSGAVLPATSTVVVQPGQSVWQIAKSVAPGADVRDTIERIAILNGFEDASDLVVHPGQKLVIPAAA